LHPRPALTARFERDASPTHMHAARSHLRGEFAGGIASAIPGLAHALTLGLLAFAPLGAEHADLGIRAGFAAVIFGGVAATVFAGTSLPATGPRASTSLILAGFVATVAADRTLGVSEILALTTLCVACAGVIQLLFGALRLGTIVKFVPHPVVAGFMCGVAILIVLSQLPHLLGVPPDVMRRPLLDWIGAIQPFTAIVGLATAAVIMIIASRHRQWPAALIGLAIGAALHYAIGSVASNTPLGPTVGTLPGGLPLPTALGPAIEVAQTPQLATHLPAVAGSALVIAIIGALDSLLAAAAIDALAGTRHHANRELVAQGVGNIVSALFGGVPVALSPTRGIPAWRAGGRTRAIGIIAPALLLAVLLIGTRALAYLPLAALAGVMITVAVGLVDNWTHGLVRRLARGVRNPPVVWSGGIVVAVAIITVLGSFIIAVSAGVLLSMAFFIGSMNRSLVRAVHDGAARPSRRVYGPDDEQRLAAQRHRLQVVELEGALFFGSVERLSTEIDALARAGADYIVIDLQRVTEIDATGALMLEQVIKRHRAAQVNVVLAGVTPKGRHGTSLIASGTFRAKEGRPWFVDADRAIEWSERRLLGDTASSVHREIPFEHLALTTGLDAAEIDTLRHFLRRRELDAEEILFREGESGSELYVLARGAISIVIRGSAGHDQRLVTFAPGSVLGEASMLDGGVRSATAVAAEDAVVYSLSRRTLDLLAARDPALSNKLLLNLDRHLSGRLRRTTDTLRELH
jgi:SulP family sulfate permease